MTSSSPALGFKGSSPPTGEPGMDALCLPASTMANTNITGSFSQASSLSSLQRALGGSDAAGTVLQQQLLGANMGAATDMDSFLEAVNSASRQLQEKREQLQQQRLTRQLLMQQQQLQTASTPSKLQLLESLLKASSNPASTAASDNQAATAAALAAAAAAGSSPLSPAGIGLSTSNLQRAVSNLSSLSACSNVTNLQHALSGIPGLQPGLSGMFGMSGPSLSGPPGLQRTLTVAESATAADLLGRLEAIKAAAAAGSPKLGQQQQQDEAIAAHPGSSAGTPPEHQQSTSWAVAVAAAAMPAAAAPSPPPATAAAADVEDEDSELLAGRVGSNDSCASHRFSRAQMVSKAQQMLLGQINQQKQQQQQHPQQQSALASADMAAAGPAAGHARPPLAALPALSGDQARSGISVGDLEGIILRAAPGIQAAAAAAATTTTCTSDIPADIQRIDSVVGPAGAFFDAAQLQKVLDDVVSTKKQAAACIKEAVALGLLPQFLLKCPRNTTPTASGATAAVAAALAGGPSSSSGAQEQPALAAKRPRDSSAQQAADEAARPAKLHRLASSSAAEAATAAEAAAAPAAAAAAAVPAASEARSSRHLDCNLSHGSSDTAIEQQQQPQQQQQQAVPMDAQPSDAQDPAAAPSSSAAAAAPLDPGAGASELGVFGLQQQHGASVMSPQGRDLFLRTVMAVSRSQRLCKQLAYMVIPAANEAATARKVALQLQQPLVEVQALQGAVQQLGQQMVLAKASLNAKQQALLKMQLEAQAAANAHTQQLDGVAQAVSKLLELAKDVGVRPSDRQRLVDICSEILKAVVRS